MKMICLNIDVTDANTFLTTVSIVLTIISIVCTISTMIMMFRTKRIKRDMWKKLNSFDLFTYIDRLHSLYLELSKQEVPQQWNDETASSFKKQLLDIEVELRSYNRFKEHVPEDKQYRVKSAIDSAFNNINAITKNINEKISHPNSLFDYSIDYPLHSLLENLNKVDEVLLSIRSELMTK